MNTPPDPLSLFRECHARIRRFSDGLERLAALDDLRDPRAPAAANACARYFREALPLHGQDEDRSLAPRLRAHGLTPEVEAAFVRMAEEHARMDVLLPDLLVELGCVERGAREDPATLQALAGPFVALLREHIALEEAVVFPACDVLTSLEKAAIVAELRARRAP
jgi:hemerythrin-like domain-containing protein